VDIFSLRKIGKFFQIQNPPGFASYYNWSPSSFTQKRQGGEFTSNEFQHYCDTHGITKKFTQTYSPHQNGVVERRNRSLMEMGRCMLLNKHLPPTLLGRSYQLFMLYPEPDSLRC
jgi:transposase InsO family protein